jgi:trans-aconitate methyltransferase
MRHSSISQASRTVKRQNSLVAEWLASVPDVQARLKDAVRPARVADFGCGVGWASIELARAFPHIRVDGIDSDDESIRQARLNAAEQVLLHRRGVALRGRFEGVSGPH